MHLIKWPYCNPVWILSSWLSIADICVILPSTPTGMSKTDVRCSWCQTVDLFVFIPACQRDSLIIECSEEILLQLLGWVIFSLNSFPPSPLSFHRLAKSSSALCRIKGTLFHWIPAFWDRHWVYWTVSQGIFYSGSVLALWSHVQHSVHCPVQPHCRISQGGRGEFNV